MELGTIITDDERKNIDDDFFRELVGQYSIARVVVM